MAVRRMLIVTVALVLASSGCRWVVRASVDVSGNEANDSSHQVALSADGRFVAFESLASNLDTTLLNRDVFGVPATEQVFSSTLADDGRYVAFSSTSANLVGNDTNDASDVFLRAIPTPRIESVTPPSVPRGTSAVLSVAGDGFAPAPTAAVSGTGITVTAVTRVSEHELRVTITVDDLAPTGARGRSW